MIADLFRFAAAAALGGVCIHYILAVAAFIAADCFDRSGSESAERWSS